MTTNKLDLNNLSTNDKVLAVCTMCCLANPDFLKSLLNDQPRPRYLADKQSFLKDLQIILLNDKTIIKYYKDLTSIPEDQNMFDLFFKPLEEFDIIKGRKILQKAQDLANNISTNIPSIKEIGIYNTKYSISLVAKTETIAYDIALEGSNQFSKNIEANSFFDALFGEGNNLNQQKYKSKMDFAVNEVFQFMKRKVDPNIWKHANSFVTTDIIDYEILNNAMLLDKHKMILGLFVPEFNANFRSFKRFFENCAKSIKNDPEFIDLYNKVIVRDIFVDLLIDNVRMFPGEAIGKNGSVEIYGSLKMNFDLVIKDLLNIWAGSRLFASDNRMIKSGTAKSLNFYNIEFPYILTVPCDGYRIDLEYSFSEGLFTGKPVIKVSIR